LERLAQDFSQQHLADKERAGYTLLFAMRGREFDAFENLRC